MSATAHCTETTARRRSRLTRGVRRTVLLVAVPTAGLMLGGTAAVAYWTVAGTGSGSAQTSTMVAPTVTNGTVSGTPLYPGLTANGTTTGGDLAVRVTNTNPYAVTVTLTQDGQPTACATPSITLLASPALTVSVGAGATVEKTFTRVVGMGTGAGNDCQGKTLSIPLRTAAQSN